MRRAMFSVCVVVALVAIGLGACGDSGKDDPGRVAVTISDFKIELGSSSAPSGKVTFAVHNAGPSTHEFVVFKSDLALDALPKDDNGDVAEAGSFTPVDEIEDIKKGSDPELEVDLAAGRYVVLCNIPGHFRQGMVAELTVT